MANKLIQIKNNPLLLDKKWRQSLPYRYSHSGSFQNCRVNPKFGPKSDHVCRLNAH